MSCPMNRGIPVALSYTPRWWRSAPEAKRQLAIEGAMSDFPDADIYSDKAGLKVLTVAPVPCAAEYVVRMNRLLASAVEYRSCQYSDPRVVNP